MLKFVRRSIIKYLIILVLTFIIGTVLFLSMNVLLDKQMEKHYQYYNNIMTNLKMLDDISNYVIGIKAHIFEITAATQSSQHRKSLNKNIKKDMEEIVLFTSSLGIDFVDSQNFLAKLEELKKENNVLMDILERREIALINNSSIKIRTLAREIRELNYLVPLKIKNILKYVKKSEKVLTERKNLYHVTLEKHRLKYLYIELFVSVIIVLITLFLSKLISQHIVKLYRKLETQLYIDELTQLKNRFALNKISNGVENPFIIILNIDLFRVINELYGTDVGNEVLKKLADIMREYFSDTKFELFRIAGDEFVLFEKDAKYSNKDIEKIVLDFLFYIKETKIYIDDISESIELDFTCGISTCKKNNLGKADIALNFAKKNSLVFAVYKTGIDNKVELKYNLFWNKEIKKGIDNDMFLPFFQPIVDRNGTIKKYESLMRLKIQEGKKVSFISPSKFLQIAKKTKSYNEISSITMFKSLNICKEKGLQITINLDKNDMKNHFLIKKLKKKIISLDIADKIIFEILESENLVDNNSIKKFITDFRELGVKFAIDDFGSGYSNFSFILDIKPNFVKIDGALIKNIAEDKSSYELVKSIVAFAKALNIITIAEFVHSKEVYEIVFDLGVDQFQGYYFGKPKKICL